MDEFPINTVQLDEDTAEKATLKIRGWGQNEWPLRSGKWKVELSAQQLRVLEGPQDWRGGSAEKHYMPWYMQFVWPTDAIKHVTS